MADETTELLIRARGFIERGWCRGRAARNFLGWPVKPLSPWATSWCAYGAIAAAGRDAGDVIELACQRFEAEIGDHEDIDDFNDAQETVEPVLAAFERAIAMGAAGAEGEPR